MEKYRKLLITLVTIIGGGCLIAACIFGITHALQSKRSQEHLDTLRNTVETTEASDSVEVIATEPTESDAVETTANATPTTEESAASGETDASGEATVEHSAVPNPYAQVFASNEDIVGWLQIPDTKIDYPVVWTPEDENYYLYRDIEGNEDQNGSLILDTDSSLNPLSTNLIIHGHNMRSGAMFGSLTDYEEPAFYENHKQIILYTEECQRNYEIIAVFRSQVYKKSDTVFKFYKFFQADTQEEFDDFYNNIKDLSLYDTGVTATFGDHFITLSTCVYHVEQGRFVVVAKEVQSGDSYLPVGE